MRRGTSVGRALAVNVVLASAAVALGGCRDEGHSEARPDVVARESALNASPRANDFALGAEGSIRLSSSVTIAGADLGARGTGSGPYLSGGVALDVSASVKTPVGRNLLADSIRLGAGATVGDLQTNRLVGTGSSHGPVSPFVMPPALPALSPVTPGTTAISVGASATSTLAPGRFKSFTLGSKATLRLAAGLYEVGDVTLGASARLEVTGHVELRIANRLSVDASGVMGPAAGSGLRAGDLRIELTGRNGTTGDLSATPKTASFGSGAVVTALLLAPNGTVVFGASAKGTGAVLAHDIDVGSSATITFQDGFSVCSAAACDDHNPCTADGCGASGCTHAPAATGTLCSDGNACNGVETCNAVGACVAGTAVVCPVADACHVTGSCAPASGTCASPAKPDGSTCDDGNPNSVGDACTAGACGGSCRPGFAGTACTDVNECALGTAGCSAHALCSNTPGSFGCSCADGYAGDGFTCATQVTAPIDPAGGGTVAVLDSGEPAHRHADCPAAASGRFRSGHGCDQRARGGGCPGAARGGRPCHPPRARGCRVLAPGGRDAALRPHANPS